MSDQPEYLRRLKENQAKHERGAPASGQGQAAALTLQEQEALKWARETATDLRAQKNLSGARYAVVLKVQSATGSTVHSLEGLPSREALVERLRPGSGYGEEVVASYEVRGGRPDHRGHGRRGPDQADDGSPPAGRESAHAGTDAAPSHRRSRGAGQDPPP